MIQNRPASMTTKTKRLASQGGLLGACWRGDCYVWGHGQRL